MWDSEVSPVKSDVPEYGKAEALYMAMEESRDF